MMSATEIRQSVVSAGLVLVGLIRCEGINPCRSQSHRVTGHSRTRTASVKPASRIPPDAGIDRPRRRGQARGRDRKLAGNIPRDAGAAGRARPGLPGDCDDHRCADWNRDVALGPRPPQGDRDASSSQVTMTENDRLLLNAYIDGEL